VGKVTNFKSFSKWLIVTRIGRRTQISKRILWIYSLCIHQRVYSFLNMSNTAVANEQLLQILESTQHQIWELKARAALIILSSMYWAEGCFISNTRTNMTLKSKNVYIHFIRSFLPRSSFVSLSFFLSVIPLFLFLLLYICRNLSSSPWSFQFLLTSFSMFYFALISSYYIFYIPFSSHILTFYIFISFFLLLLFPFFLSIFLLFYLYYSSFSPIFLVKHFSQHNCHFTTPYICDFNISSVWCATPEIYIRY
jgi:hypothetical protein